MTSYEVHVSQLRGDFVTFVVVIVVVVVVVVELPLLSLLRHHRCSIMV